MKVWRRCCSSNRTRSVRPRMPIAAASIRDSAASRCPRPEPLRPSRRWLRGVETLDLHGPFDAVEAFLLHAHRYKSFGGCAPEARDARRALVVARIDRGLYLTQVGR